MRKFYRCCNQDCEDYVEDEATKAMLLDKSICLGVPVVTQTQAEGFERLGIVLDEMENVVRCKKIDRDTMLGFLDTLESEATRKHLLPCDNTSRSRQLDDAFENVKRAVRKQDKVGFRNAFYSLYAGTIKEKLDSGDGKEPRRYKDNKEDLPKPCGRTVVGSS